MIVRRNGSTNDLKGLMLFVALVALTGTTSTALPGRQAGAATMSDRESMVFGCIPLLVTFQDLFQGYYLSVVEITRESQIKLIFQDITSGLTFTLELSDKDSLPFRPENPIYAEFAAFLQHVRCAQFARILPKGVYKVTIDSSTVRRFNRGKPLTADGQLLCPGDGRAVFIGRISIWGWKDGKELWLECEDAASEIAGFLERHPKFRDNITEYNPICSETIPNRPFCPGTIPVRK